jgi:hypothetical protein
MKVPVCAEHFVEHHKDCNGFVGLTGEFE